MSLSPEEIKKTTEKAIRHFWKTRAAQLDKQKSSGTSDQGQRGSVTGGAQMNGFVDLVSTCLIKSGVDKSLIFKDMALELPGYFRPEKKWDLIVVQDDILIAALEAKSQVGPSFGNNFNNRTEEAIGSAQDLWTAFREGAFNRSRQPWLGYIFHLEDCLKSTTPVKVREPHFKVFPEFKDASYMKRYELLCHKLLLERYYTATAFVTSDMKSGLKGKYREPNHDLTIFYFVNSLVAHARGVLG